MALTVFLMKILIFVELVAKGMCIDESIGIFPANQMTKTKPILNNEEAALGNIK